MFSQNSWCLQCDYVPLNRNLSACVWMCDVCLFLDGIIRGNYNASVSTSSSASLRSSSCIMRGKSWRFSCIFYMVSLHSYNKPHHADRICQGCQRESHCHWVTESKERQKRGRVEGRLGERERDKKGLLSFSGTPVCLFTIIHCDLGPFQGEQLHSY